MVTINRVVRAYLGEDGMVQEIEFKGVSDDVKPTNCGDNSLFLELDTGDVYYYESASGSWLLAGSSGSSGGDGGEK